MTSGDVWIIGTSMTNFGRFADKDLLDLAAEASLAALADADLTMADVGILAMGNVYEANSHNGQRLQKQIGQTGIPVFNAVNGCATGATADEIVNAEMISYPNTLPMCCPTGDGGAAAVMVSDAKYRKLDPGVRRRAVKISASVLTSDPWTATDQVQPDVNKLTKMAADQAYDRAGIGPDELDLVELHDCFATAELIHYDNVRLCEPGGAGDFIDSGAPLRDGRIPVNVSGGLLSKGDPLGATGIANGTEALALVHPDQDGVAATAVTGMDASRPWTRCDLREARLSREFLYPVSGLTAKLHRALGIYAALDAVGAARKALERTLSYARVREQFGRPLGSFQAYKHACSTAFIDLKLAQSVSFRAATTPGDEGLRYALASAVDATASATRVCMTVIQLHGGIGFSAESGLDRYLRRSRADELIVGRRHSLRALVRTLAAVTTANYEEERA